MTTRHRQTTTDVAHLEHCKTALGMDNAALAECLHCSPSALSGWLRDGKAPGWTIPACRGLLADHQAKAPKARTLLVEVAAESEELVAKMLTAMGVRWTVVSLGGETEG